MAAPGGRPGVRMWATAWRRIGKTRARPARKVRAPSGPEVASNLRRRADRRPRTGGAARVGAAAEALARAEGLGGGRRIMRRLARSIPAVRPRPAIAALLAAGALGVVAGCGSNDSSTSPATGASTSAASTAASTAAPTTAEAPASTTPAAGDSSQSVTDYAAYVGGSGKADAEQVAGVHRLGEPGGRPADDRRRRDRRRGPRRPGRQRHVRRHRRAPAQAEEVLHQERRGGGHDLRPEARQRPGRQARRDGRRGDRDPGVLLVDRQAGDHRRRGHAGRRRAEERDRPVRRRDPRARAVRHLRARRPRTRRPPRWSTRTSPASPTARRRCRRGCRTPASRSSGSATRRARPT